MITQGKWEVEEHYGLFTIGTHDEPVCKLWELEEETHNKLEFENTKANAELIASAPETKKQLDEAMADWSGLRDAVMGENNHTCINRSVVEGEANLHREKIIAIKRQRDELYDAAKICLERLGQIGVDGGTMGDFLADGSLRELAEAIANAEREGN